MTGGNKVANHYTQSDLLEAITSGVEKLGKTPTTVNIQELAAVDEFHIGGSEATRSFIDQIAVSNRDHVLDIGCGIGGASRFLAQTYHCQVTGIDLTAAFVKTGNELCSWVGLEDRVRLVQGNALSMDFSPSTFDKSVMLHVGMNINDKESLAREAWRVLKPGGVMGIYDVMRIGDGELFFPVPWATTAESSAVSSVQEYKDALTKAGFVVTGERDRHEFAMAFFERLQADATATKGPPPLGLHILMGNDAPIKIKNMIENIAHGKVAPIELIVQKTNES